MAAMKKKLDEAAEMKTKLKVSPLFFLSFSFCFGI